MTYYFRRKVTLPALPADVQVQVRTFLDDGYVLWVNGQRAHFLGMDNVDPAHATLASRSVGDAALEGPFTIPASLLVPGENTFAAEVHQNNAGSSDIVFGLEVTLVGGTSEPATPGLANNVSATLDEFPTLRINEVLARNTAGRRDNTGTAEPWIELVNTGPDAVSLDGLYLSDTDANPTRWAFANGLSIPAGGFMTVFADGEPAQSTPTEPHASFRLPSTPGSPIHLALSRIENGTNNNVDFLKLVVGSQPDVSAGRLPDGFVPSLADMIPTPGASNAGIQPNRPPTFAPFAGVDVDEGNAVDVILDASDPDQPGQTLTFELLQGPPTLTLSAAGHLAWAPTENDGPSTNPIVVRVSDNGSPVLNATNRFNVIVREVNQAPVFAAIAEQRIDEGTPWTFDLTATDADRPVQTLTFALVQGPPALTISAVGRVAWTPGSSDVGPHTVVARATDSWVPALSATANISVVVIAATSNQPPHFDPPTRDADGHVSLVLRGNTGSRYRIESSSGLGPWTTMSEWVADPAGLVIPITPDAATPVRFYRAVLLP